MITTAGDYMYKLAVSMLKIYLCKCCKNQYDRWKMDLVVLCHLNVGRVGTARKLVEKTFVVDQTNK